MTSAQLDAPSRATPESLKTIINLMGNKYEANLNADFTLRNLRFNHPEYQRITGEIARVHYRSVKLGVPEGLLIYAQSGTGKTTALTEYAAEFPRKRVEGCMKIPVLYVKTPSRPTVRSLSIAILRSLEDVVPKTGNTETMTSRIAGYFNKCGVELLIIDEFQHFHYARRSGSHSEVTDWLKLLLETTKVCVILAGLPRSQSVINQNEQLSRRFSGSTYMQPFSITREKDFQIFRGVLKQIHSELPAGSLEIHDADVARRFFFASEGIIDYVIKIVDRAVSSCCHGNTIGLEDFERAFEKVVWPGAPKRLNPFSTNPLLRTLNERYEPFANLDDVSKYRAKSTRETEAQGAA
ncbi:MAG: TniB family NTP-binding protein [Rhodocyclaceae bacterium]|nr:TniB family NTP-binding protein [Rhodocyclaceae bacterium]